jgi:hypothetical protein
MNCFRGEREKTVDDYHKNEVSRNNAMMRRGCFQNKQRAMMSEPKVKFSGLLNAIIIVRLIDATFHNRSFVM